MQKLNKVRIEDLKLFIEKLYIAKDQISSLQRSKLCVLALHLAPFKIHDDNL